MLDAEPVVWHRVTTDRDKYGDGDADESPAVTLTGLLAARSFLENVDVNSPAVVDLKQLYLLDAPGEPGASDWFEIRGQRYEAQGQAHRWSGTQVEVSVKYVGDMP